MSRERDDLKIARSELLGVMEEAYREWVNLNPRSSSAPPPEVLRVAARTRRVSVGPTIRRGGPGCLLEQAFGDWWGKGPALYLDQGLRLAVGDDRHVLGVVVEVVDG